MGREGTLGNGLGYVSVAVPYGIRVSRIYEAGGELVYGFGYFDVRSPSGYAVRARVAARRGSFLFIYEVLLASVQIEHVSVCVARR